VGNHLFWPDSEDTRTLRGALPKVVQDRISLIRDWNGEAVAFDAVLHHGDADQLRGISQQLARRNGPLVAIIGLPAGDTDIPLERLLIERTLSVNTAAAGGNASLMTIG
jgi:RHH-type proline utilization regulon transcriptional repressor/proline dehydrogenase/delta 1-pyrroline-5-carboxylate dehydrogenase